jgi:hypothetical protein
MAMAIDPRRLYSQGYKDGLRGISPASSERLYLLGYLYGQEDRRDCDYRSDRLLGEER